MTLALFPAMVSVALLGLAARGLGLFLAALVPGFIGLFLFGAQGQFQMIWAPLYLGVLLAAYNLGSGKPLILTIAVSQLVIVTAPVPTLVAHLSWLAIPAGLAGLIIAGLAALLVASRGASFEAH